MGSYFNLNKSSNGFTLSCSFAIALDIFEPIITSDMENIKYAINDEQIIHFARSET